MTTRDLIDALVSGDSIDIEDTFNNAMAERLSSALDTYKSEVAQRMFSSSVEETE
jgi:hypothetical protein